MRKMPRQSLRLLMPWVARHWRLAALAGMLTVLLTVHAAHLRLKCKSAPAAVKHPSSELSAIFKSDLASFSHFMRQRPATHNRTTAEAEDRCILMCVGSATHLANAFVNAYTMRHYFKSKLPIKMLFWSELGEAVNATAQHWFQEQINGLEFLDGSMMQYPGHHRKLILPELPRGADGYKVKAAALYMVSCNQVLSLDSDSMPLVQPEKLFELSAFQEHGNVFWPDRACFGQDFATPERLFDLLGIQWRKWDNKRAAESGQFLIDRQRHADVLEWLLFLNARGEVTYELAWGDKDTFHAAFHLAGKAEHYYQSPFPVSAALYRTPTGKWEPRGFLQHHPTTSGLLFMHRTNLNKYRLQSAALHPVSHLLLQPACEFSVSPSSEAWSEEMPDMTRVSRSARFVTAAKCSYDLQDLVAIWTTCGLEPDPAGDASLRTPPVVEVPPESHLARAQEAADGAFSKLLEQLQADVDFFVH